MSYPFTEVASSSPESHLQVRPEVYPKPAPLSTAVSLPRRSFSPTPSDPIQDAFQEEMLWFFHMEGYWGLAFTIWTRAIELIRNAPNSYRRFLAEDYTKGTFHLFTLLLTLPRKLIESLIKNTLPYDIVQDASVGRFVTMAMQPAPIPGIYMNIPTRGRSVLTHHSSQASSDVGKWLSSSEAEAMVDFVQEYLDLSAPSGHSKAFDRHLTCGFADVKELIDSPKLRRYASNTKQARDLQRWANRIKTMYVTGNTSDPALKFVRCPIEVGWSKDIEKRLSEHAKNWHTTGLFAFFHAYSRCKLPSSNSFPVTSQYTLFPIWDNDRELARVAEIAATLLTSSMGEHGGLNANPPGNITIRGAIPARVWDSNAQGVFLREHVLDALQAEVDFVEETEKAWTDHPKIKELEEENKALEKEWKKMEDAIADLDEKKVTLSKELEELKAKRLEQVATGHVSNSAVVNRLRKTIIPLIRRYENEEKGRSMAIEDSMTGTRNVQQLRDRDALQMYREVAADVELRQAKAVTAWHKHHEAWVEEATKQQYAADAEFEAVFGNFALVGTTMKEPGQM